MARTFCGGVPCALSPARRASLERLRRPCARCCAEGPSGAHHEGYGRRELGTVGARKRLVLPSETTAKSFPRDEADMLKLLTTSLSTGYGDHPEIGPGEKPQRLDLPTQAQTVTRGSEPSPRGVALEERDDDKKKVSDLDYLSELLAIQQSGPKDIGFFGTRNMGFLHQQLIEILSYAMVLTGNHIYTSGATGTNAAVIRGALRAESPDLLTVVLPQSLSKQPEESQHLLSQVQNVVEMPHNDHLPLLEASRICNRDIISRVRQVICFAFHDSKLLIETMEEARESKKMVTMFFLD